MKEYWIVYKPNGGNHIYVSGLDEFNHPMHTDDESKAFKFHDFHFAMAFTHYGYCLRKEYEFETHRTAVSKRTIRQNLLLLWKQICKVHLYI